MGLWTIEQCKTENKKTPPTETNRGKPGRNGGGEIGREPVGQHKRIRGNTNKHRGDGETLACKVYDIINLRLSGRPSKIKEGERDAGHRQRTKEGKEICIRKFRFNEKCHRHSAKPHRAKAQKHLIAPIRQPDPSRLPQVRRPVTGDHRLRKPPQARTDVLCPLIMKSQAAPVTLPESSPGVQCVPRSCEGPYHRPLYHHQVVVVSDYLAVDFELRLDPLKRYKLTEKSHHGVSQKPDPEKPGAVASRDLERRWKYNRHRLQSHRRMHVYAGARVVLHFGNRSGSPTAATDAAGHGTGAWQTGHWPEISRCEEGKQALNLSVVKPQCHAVPRLQHGNLRPLQRDCPKEEGDCDLQVVPGRTEEKRGSAGVKADGTRIPTNTLRSVADMMCLTA
jgi:hypothetical protein